jgi:hypothetical protein
VRYCTAMTQHFHNRLRQLQGLVTIDAWHEGQPQSGRVDLHAYVNFDEARLGGQVADEIAFRLQLKRAELKLLQSEPKSFTIDPANIWRGDEDTSGKTTYTIEDGKSRSSDANAKLTIGPSPELELTGGGKASSTESRKIETTIDRSTKTISVSFSRNDRDQPTWVLKPDRNAPRLDDILLLDGQPWDDKKQNLLALHVNAKHESQEMLSALRLCLICRREDLYFYDIQTRKLGEEFQPLLDASPKRIIVQEYLRDALISEGLHAGDMNSPFSIINLGEAVSEQRRPESYE